jgi:hypothetical protein
MPYTLNDRDAKIKSRERKRLGSRQGLECLDRRRRQEHALGACAKLGSMLELARDEQLVEPGRKP